MTTDDRALCAELADTLERTQKALMYEGGCTVVTNTKRLALIDRARAALAQPEPEGATDEELIAAAEEAGFAYTDNECLFNSHYEGTDIKSEVLSFARAVLARWGRPAITPIPVSELLEPEWVRQEDQTHKTTDHAQLIDGEWWAPCSDLFSMQRIVDNARAHSARWGRQPAPDAAAPCATGG